MKHVLVGVVCLGLGFGASMFWPMEFQSCNKYYVCSSFEKSELSGIRWIESRYQYKYMTFLERQRVVIISDRTWEQWKEEDRCIPLARFVR